MQRQQQWYNANVRGIDGDAATMAMALNSAFFSLFPGSTFRVDYVFWELRITLKFPTLRTQDLNHDTSMLAAATDGLWPKSSNQTFNIS